uniref:Uncharacterized protein n=1 Tax=Arundo donax TaxID=35708 RepID=A0A0A9E6L0_ARUDO
MLKPFLATRMYRSDERWRLERRGCPFILTVCYCGEGCIAVAAAVCGDVKLAGSPLPKGGLPWHVSSAGLPPPPCTVMEWITPSFGPLVSSRVNGWGLWSMAMARVLKQTAC